MKRIFLFLATNLAVILLLTLVINLLGLDSISMPAWATTSTC